MPHSEQWTCDFCGFRQIESAQNTSGQLQSLDIGLTKHGLVGLSHYAARCVNDDCNEVTLLVGFNRISFDRFERPRVEGTIRQVTVAPRSKAKPQPEFIPSPIREDYEEACLIRDDSPKASATLARRALQGMIRDFCGISERTLMAEIKKLEALVEQDAAPKGVEHETIAAIHAVRQIGNIGAHMEQDINQIVDVDPREAQALIDLLELLFAEWYVARKIRQDRLAKILEINDAKQVARSQPAPALPAPEQE